MVKTPLIRQLEARECGAVALGIILAFYGKHVSRSALRDACGVTRDGVSILGIVRAAHGYGLSAQVVKRQRLDGIAAPFVIYWNFNHFLVVEAVSAQGIQVNDPAYGRAFLSNALIERYFTGIVLTFRPTDAFVPDSRAVGGQLRSLLHPYLAVEISRALLDVGVVMAIVHQQLHPALLVFAVAYIVLRVWTLRHLDHRYTAPDRFRRMLALPVIFFSRIHVDELVSRQLETYTLAVAHATALQPLVYAGRAAVYVIGILLVAPPFVAVILLAVVACWLAFYAVEQMRRQSAANHITREQLAGLAFNGMRSIEAIKLQGGEAAFMQQLQRAQAAADGQPFTVWTLPPILLPTLNLIALSIFAAALVETGAVSLPDAVIGYCLSLLILMPASAAGAAIHRIRDLQHEIERVSDLPAPSADKPPSAFGDAIALEGVSFGYGEAPVLHDITLHVRRGQSVGIVGRSGSGKSTLLQLMAGLYTAQHGAVSIPHAQLALVASQPFVLDAAIADNISLFDAQLSPDAIERAARDAGLHDAIMRLPDGYAQRISPTAHPFSSGQVQCLEIARALVCNPAFLLLDEATAAMDAITEALVLANIARRGCAAVMISHRVSTLRSADEILVMAQGRIVERGTHAALMDGGQVYPQLVAGGDVR